jgi:3-oxoacyl-[acyl-carrier protein] reductase
MDLGLRGKIAMITGASRGLGRAMAGALGEEGVKLSICARGQDMLNAAAAELRGLGHETLALTADVTDAADMSRWLDQTRNRFGGVDILINNAGGAKPGALAELSDEAWRAAFELNFFAAVRLSRLAAENMEARGGGAIINISSIWGREAGGVLTYTSSKAAMISFTKMLAREMAPKNVRVNSIAPGSILYPGGSWERRFRDSPAFERDFIAHELPAGRLGRPEEVAYAVLMLASPRASWINGACLPVDGAQGRSLI